MCLRWKKQAAVNLLDTKTGKLLLDPLAHAENLGAESDIGGDTKMNRERIESVFVLG